MHFRLPLPKLCRGCRKRKPEACRLSVQAVSFGGFNDAAGWGHGGETLVEGGGAYPANGVRIGEWLSGDRSGLAVRFNDFEGESAGPLCEFEGSTPTMAGWKSGFRAAPRLFRYVTTQYAS
jgi:hypothetical protein